MMGNDGEHRSPEDGVDRRRFLREGLRTAAVVAVGGGGGLLLARSQASEAVWQIDPQLCAQCGRCETECVLSPSAVKCVHAFDVCGYCALCGGYHRPRSNAKDTAAENQLCPSGAIRRTFIEHPFFEYTIEESLCTGCAKCVKGCGAFGNGSLYLQVRHDRCLSCNECAISRVCPSQAFRRVPASRPYLLRQGGGPSA